MHQAEPASSSVCRARGHERWKPYLFLLPMLVFALLFCYYPAIRSLVYSVTVVNGKGEITGWAGFSNFSYLFSSRTFQAAIRNTLFLTGAFVPINLLLSLVMALLANKRRRFSPVYETCFTMPMAISMPALCLIFKVLLSPTVGYLNQFLGVQWGWFQDQSMAMWGIILICLWMGVSFDFLRFLSALRAVPEPLIEAATIDGAGAFTRFFRIVLPRLSPTILYVVCTNVALAMMTSGPILILTQGGPNRSTTTLIQMLYTTGYGSSNYSLASCISVAAFLLTFGITLLAFYFERKAVSYE